VLLACSAPAAATGTRQDGASSSMHLLRQAIWAGGCPPAPFSASSLPVLCDHTANLWNVRLRAKGARQQHERLRSTGKGSPPLGARARHHHNDVQGYLFASPSTKTWFSK